MMNFMTKAYVTAQVKAQAFAQDNRGSIIEYVMIIALAGVFIGLAKPELTGIITDTVAKTKAAIAP
ncbi:pilus assembly protein [Yersinia pseudotuberculosis]|uniref:Pilin protein, major subunit n=1 Tax=Yersinia pseudotuberculosis TaxID=633 RepID=A0A380QCZ4_YERPU|nr:pilus assembly protein [Yersinia pseudotuberculosis]PSH11410.1 pilus assembly protein [Yersinia pseudotuberculosis]SUP86000.1 pilin protein, major subunit [Yersinia pseudotuberculosis]